MEESGGFRRDGVKAVFLTDDRLRLFAGARCELLTGEVVEVAGRRTPFYDLARELDARGYGECHLQIRTPTGTPSLRGLVKVMAGLTVEETDKGGLRLRNYRPFPLGGRLADRQDGVSGAGVPERPKSGSAAPFQSGQAVA